MIAVSVNLFMTSLRGSRVQTDEKGKFVEYEVRREMRVQDIERKAMLVIYYR